MKANLNATDRYREIAAILTGNPQATAEEGVEWVRYMVDFLKIPGLSTYGIKESDLGSIADKAARASSMKANPIALTHDQLTQILREAM
jgi:alcohol dehydrogenase class IV